jgi:hypothetical protein
MIVPVLVVEVTVYVIETVVIQHGTILVAIVIVRIVKIINGKDVTHRRVCGGNKNCHTHEVSPHSGTNLI